MAEYYLISQLPSLGGVSGKPPITEERFFELCDSLLSEKMLAEVKKLTLVPPRDTEKAGSSLINAWNSGERNLRLALAELRAKKMQKEFKSDTALPTELLRLAATAVELDDPMRAEDLLLKHRLDFLESLRPTDGFSADYVLYYGLKLKLLWRKSRFDTELGEAEYRKIYSSVLNGEASEAI